MKDEVYLFRQEVREKSSTARSARNKRTHNGKSGRVKFPSDYMTKKELSKMNGEVKSYRLNEPMSWSEFKAMPDDIKVTYIKLLREKFNVPDKYIAEMFGISQWSVCTEAKRLGIATGTKNCHAMWDKEGFLAWRGGVKVEEPVIEEPAEEPVVQEETCIPEEVIEDHIICEEVNNHAIPCNGSMVFEGKVSDVLNTIGVLLGGANVHISITWDVLE